MTFLGHSLKLMKWVGFQPAMMLVILCMMASNATADDNIIKMAVAGPMTGSMAPMGEQMRRGAALGVEHLNAKGGINGRKIELEVVNDRGDPKQAEVVARRLTKKGTQFVIGHYNSGPSIYASEIYAKGGVLMVSPASTNPSFTERDPRFIEAPFLARNLWNTHRTSGRDDVQGTILGKYIAEKFNGKAVAFLYDGTGYGTGFVEKAESALKASNADDGFAAIVKPGQTNFSSIINRMKKNGIEVVFFGGLGEDMGRLVQQSHKAGFKPQFVAGDGIYTYDFTELAGSAAEGTLMAFSKDDRLGSSAWSVVKTLRDQGFEPEAYTLKAYAAVQVIAKGIELAGTSEPKAVAGKIRSGIPIRTVLGMLTFDGLGDRIEPDVTLYVWRKDARGNIGPVPVE
ncbi:branched-chain amino acid ABC transporter substrate-binding protein [Corticibacterium sp. UT-5YL-CI-8]|nr:branched-chain amino acid ABC transporter substrate-binding protein [Tianweitania sp. UT-5YL-CI-8]